MPLELRTLEDELGFSTEVIQLSKDICLIFDDGSTIDFKAGTDLNSVSSKAELINDSLKIAVEDIKIFDPSQTISTTIVNIWGNGFYDGFQEWWFVTRVIGKETFQFLRYNLRVELEDGLFKTFEAGTKWTECIHEIERGEQRANKYVEPEFHTVSCLRKCCSPMVPLVNPQEIPEDLLEDIRLIMDSDD